MVGAIAGSTKREPITVGKPAEFMLDNIAKTFNLQRQQICMVGDRLDTDILFGKNGGLTTCLVLSGGCLQPWAWGEGGGEVVLHAPKLSPLSTHAPSFSHQCCASKWHTPTDFVAPWCLAPVHELSESESAQAREKVGHTSNGWVSGSVCGPYTPPLNPLPGRCLTALSFALSRPTVMRCKSTVLKAALSSCLCPSTYVLGVVSCHAVLWCLIGVTDEETLLSPENKVSCGMGWPLLLHHHRAWSTLLHSHTVLYAWLTASGRAMLHHGPTVHHGHGDLHNTPC